MERMKEGGGKLVNRREGGRSEGMKKIGRMEG